MGDEMTSKGWNLGGKSRSMNERVCESGDELGDDVGSE